MFKKIISGGFSTIYTPTITSPTSGQILTSTTPTITSSSFLKLGNISHVSTDWQVSDSSDFSSIRWQSLDDTTNKTSITTSNLGGGDRYVRVRYKSNTSISEWSTAVLFTSPWASGSNATLTSSTNMDVNATTTITFQPGTYRVTLWGGGGGGAAGGGNGSRNGGGAGSVSKDVLYASITNVTFTVGTKGGYGNGSAGGGTGGSPGGGSGGNSAGGITWTGGGGGGYSSGLSMVAAGGGGAGADGGGHGGPGGNGNGAGGSAGGSGNAGSSGSGGGGGGGGSNAGNQTSGGPGNGGSNSGSYSSAYNASVNLGQAANRYYSSIYSRYFGDADQNGGIRIQKISDQNLPQLSITSNISTTFSTTAGSSNNFSVSATDTANTDSTVSYQWYLSTNGGGSYSTISGATTNTLTRYNPFYYSDNTHKIFCRATVTNTIGTVSIDSNVCTLTVGRNYDCSGSTVTGSIKIMSSGLHDNSYTWASWSPGFDDICDITGYTNTFKAGGRCNFCQLGGVQQGWEMELELRIVRSNGTRLHWGTNAQSSTGCDYGGSKNYQINANGGGWTPEVDGTPTFQLGLNYARCRNGVSGDIGQETYDDTYLNYSYKRRVYYYETRP